MSNKLLTSIAAIAEQTTSSKKDDNQVSQIMLNTLGKVKKTYLLSAIDEIQNKFISVEKYITEELGYSEIDIKKLKKLFSN